MDVIHLRISQISTPDFLYIWIHDLNRDSQPELLRSFKRHINTIFFSAHKIGSSHDSERKPTYTNIIGLIDHFIKCMSIFRNKFPIDRFNTFTCVKNTLTERIMRVRLNDKFDENLGCEYGPFVCQMIVVIYVRT